MFGEKKNKHKICELSIWLLGAGANLMTHKMTSTSVDGVT